MAVGATGDVYVVDQTNNRVLKFTGTGTYLTQWGSLGSGDGQFDGPFGVSTDAAGDVYVSDTANHRIQKFSSAGTYLCQLGTFGSGNGQLAFPAGVALGGGSIYVADNENHRIQKFATMQTATDAPSWGRLKSRYRRAQP